MERTGAVQAHSTDLVLVIMIYGRSISAKEIVTGDTPIVPSAKPLVDALDQVFLTK
jgi:hypothetical protein